MLGYEDKLITGEFMIYKVKKISGEELIHDWWVYINPHAPYKALAGFIFGF